MPIGFENIHEHVVPLDQSPHGNWFAPGKTHSIHPSHVELIKPLDKPASQFLWDFISTSGLHNQTPFKKDFFRTVDQTKVLMNNAQEIKKWLYQRGLAFDKPVFLSWQPDDAMIVPWKMVVKYSEELAPGGDDLTVFDGSLNWALLFYHEGEVYFGSNELYVAENPLPPEGFW